VLGRRLTAFHLGKLAIAKGSGAAIGWKVAQFLIDEYTLGRSTMASQKGIFAGKIRRVAAEWSRLRNMVAAAA